MILNCHWTFKENGVCGQWKRVAAEIDALAEEDVRSGIRVPFTQDPFITGPSIERCCPLLGLLQFTFSVNTLQTCSEVCLLGDSVFYQAGN